MIVCKYRDIFAIPNPVEQQLAASPLCLLVVVAREMLGYEMGLYMHCVFQLNESTREEAGRIARV